MGVVIVGPSGAGKSTLWRMLRAAVIKTGKVVSMIQLCHLSFFFYNVHVCKKKYTQILYIQLRLNPKICFFSPGQTIYNESKGHASTAATGADRHGYQRMDGWCPHK